MNRPYPNIWSLSNLVAYCKDGTMKRCVDRDGIETFVPQRPLGYRSFRGRFHAAWMVFTGRADAVWWD